MEFKNFNLSKTVDNYYKFTILFLIFLLLAFDRDMAVIYLLIMFGDYVWYKSDNFISFPISRGNSGFMVYVESLAGLGVFLLISTLLVSAFDPAALQSPTIIGSAQSIFHLLATSTPILKGSKFLTFLGWGLLIPLIETTFWNGRLLEGLSVYIEPVLKKKIDLNRFSLTTFYVMILVASLFTLFHITAKGLESIPLLITFIFSLISSILVIRHRELKGAILMHMVTNTAAVASSFGLF